MQTSSQKQLQRINNITQDETLNMQNIFAKILNRWPWIILSLLISLSVAYAYLRYASPVYKSKASLMIRDDKKGGSPLDNQVLRGLNIEPSSQSLDNEMEILKSYDLIESVVRREQLYVDIKTKGRLVERTVYGNEEPLFFSFANPDTVERVLNWTLREAPAGEWTLIHHGEDQPLHVTPGKWYRINGLAFKTTVNPLHVREKTQSKKEETEYAVTVKPLPLAINGFIKNLNIKVVGKAASIVYLEFTDYNRQKAVSALSALINIYNKQGLDDKKRENENTLEFLEERVAMVERELQLVESKVENFKSGNRITDVSTEGQQYQQLSQAVDEQKAQQQSQLNILEGLEKRIRENQNDPKLVPSTAGITEPTLSGLIQNHNALIHERDRKLQIYGPKNPLNVDMENDIANVRESILSNIANLKSAYNTALTDINKRESALSARIRTIPKIEKNLLQINRDQNVKQQLYFILLQRREETAISLASTTVDSRVVEAPRSMGIVSPKGQTVLLVGIVVGLLLPIGIIYLMDAMNNKIESKMEVEQKCHAPLLGEISYSKKTDSPIIITKGSRSIIAEQFRVIRTNISFTGRGKKSEVILVTSHRPEEGKSFTSLNLAASYALLNKKVIVLEFDLRKPRLSQNLNIKADIGISNYLNNSGNLKSMLKEVPGFDNNFWLLPSGPIPPNPAELILGPKMDDLVKELKEQFDYIIFDTPPYTLVTDSSLLSAHSDISVIVLRNGFTFKWVLQEINKKIQDNPDQPYYTVLNRVDERSRYGAYRNYGYGYAEYFDAPERKKKWYNIFKK
ncbi:MAG: polysaccharide biosynthesis tyrosine autokinase [Chitinophagaceae bacterium]|nr:polysaccharide biosynthesis tyrosine autokinase [Chitinophagaceae bacterium]